MARGVKYTDKRLINSLVSYYNKDNSLSETSAKFSIPSITIYGILKREGVDTKRTFQKMSSRIRKYKVNENYFEKIDNRNKAYILGFLCADGNLYKTPNSEQVRLKITDLDILEDIRKKMGAEKPLLHYSTGSDKHKKQGLLIITSKKMVGDLIKLGCGYRKTWTLRPPKIDKKYYPDFIRGFFDGDGCMYVGSRTGRMNPVGEIKIVATIFMCKWLFKYLRENGIKSYYEPDKRHSSDLVQYLRVRNNSDIIMFKELIYKRIGNLLYLKRKKDKFDDFIEKRKNA